MPYRDPVKFKKVNGRVYVEVAKEMEDTERPADPLADMDAAVLYHKKTLATPIVFMKNRDSYEVVLKVGGVEQQVLLSGVVACPALKRRPLKFRINLGEVSNEPVEVVAIGP